MNKLLGSIKNKTEFLGAVIIAAIVGGLSVAAVQAAIPDSNGVIHGCYKNSTGTLKVIDTENGGSCSSAETPLNWNQKIESSAYAHEIGVSDGSQVIQQLDSERTKNITSATFVQTAYGTGLCYQVSFEPKNASVTSVNGNTTEVAIKSASTGWSDGLSGGSTAESSCSGITGSNAFIETNSNEYFVKFTN